MAVTIRPILRSETEYLSELALRSKAFWDYSEAFIEACRDELTVPPEHFQSYHCAELDGRVVGFYGLTSLTSERAELEALFVEPAVIGQGIGKALMQHAIANASADGASRLLIQGDPHARAFYIAAGARQIGERPSGSIPGRQLPLFEIRLKA